MHKLAGTQARSCATQLAGVRQVAVVYTLIVVKVFLLMCTGLQRCTSLHVS